MHLPDIKHDKHYVFLPIGGLTDEEKEAYIREIKALPCVFPSEQPLKNFEGFVGTWEGFRIHTQSEVRE